MEWELRRWYAVYTRSRHEKLVAASLEGKAFEIYLPLLKGWSNRRGKRVLVEKPAFPGYLFVHCELTHPNWVTIKKTPGVVRLVSVGDEPTPIPDEQIQSLQIALSNAEHVEGHPYLNVGDKVIVVSGPLKGTIGFLEEVSRSKKKLIISIDMLQRSIAVSVDSWRVERLESR